MTYYVFASSDGKWKRDNNGDGTFSRYFDGPVMEFDKYQDADDAMRTSSKYAMMNCDPRTKLVCKPITSELPQWMTVER